MLEFLARDIMCRWHHYYNACQRWVCMKTWLCCAQVLLTATAYYDGTQRHVKGAAPLEYYGYGSAASEVEVKAHVLNSAGAFSTVASSLQSEAMALPRA